MRFISLFAGIGGIDLGFERAGMTCVAQVEKDPFALAVLEKHWPNVPKFEDVHDVGKHNLPPTDVITGGFPCQPHSLAGKQRGAEDDRNLWPEYRRIVEEIRPRWVIAENVPGIKFTILDEVLFDLENLNYTAWTLSIPACAFGAPHIRQRIFVIAYNNSFRQKGKVGQTFEKIESQKEWSDFIRSNWWAVEPDVGRMVHGIPTKLDKRRLAALGNAVVPQVAEYIARIVIQTDKILFPQEKGGDKN